MTLQPTSHFEKIALCIVSEGGLIPQVKRDKSKSYTSYKHVRMCSLIENWGIFLFHKIQRADITKTLKPDDLLNYNSSRITVNI